MGCTGNEWSMPYASDLYGINSGGDSCRDARDNFAEMLVGFARLTDSSLLCHKVLK